MDLLKNFLVLVVGLVTAGLIIRWVWRSDPEAAPASTPSTGQNSQQQNDAESTELWAVDYNERPVVYVVGLLIWFAIMSVVYKVAVQPYWPEPGQVFGVMQYVAITVALLLAAWIGTAYWQIPLEKFGASTFLGIRTKTFDSGPYPAPIGLFKRFTFGADVYEVPVPGPKNQIAYVDDKEAIEPGMVRAWHMLTGTAKSQKESSKTNNPPTDEKQERLRKIIINIEDILNTQQVVVMTGFVTWQVDRKHAFNYIVMAGADPQQVKAQILGFAEAQLGDIVSKYTILGISQNLVEIADELKKRLQKIFRRYGIVIVDVNIDPPNISHDLANAIRDMNKERTLAVKKRIGADYMRYELEQTAAGNATYVRKEEEAKVVGRAEGTKKAAELMEMKAKDVYTGQVTENSIGESDSTWVPFDSIKDVLGGIGFGGSTKAEREGGEK